MSSFRSYRQTCYLLSSNVSKSYIQTFTPTIRPGRGFTLIREMSSIKYELDPALKDPDNPEKLLKFPAPEPEESEEGFLSRAARNGDINTIREAKVDDCNVQDPSSSNTPLIWGSDCNQVEVVKELLKKPGIHVNVRGFLGATALSRACRRGNDDIVSLLISHPDIDPNIPNGKLQYPLHFAAFQQHHSVVLTLLKSGKCDPFVKDRKGRLPVEDTKCPKIQELFQPFMKDIEKKS